MAPSVRARLDLGSYLRMTELADYIVPFTIRAVCELGVANELVDGPLNIDEVATRVGAHAPSLHRALRALASKGIFIEEPPGAFALTPLAQPLRSDHPLSLRHAYPLLAADIDAWAHFDHCVSTGEPSFDHVHGVDYWTWMAERPHDNVRFNASQQAATRLELRTVLPAYPWASLRTLVDVGGGNGAFLAGILTRFRSLRGTVQDLPHVVDGAADVLTAEGVADRADIHAGSFFEAVPSGADAYLLKRILYGWNDERAAALLSTVRAAMRPDSRLLILEPVMRSGNDEDVGKLYDLLLFTLAGGAARTQQALGDLLLAVGLIIRRVVPTMMFPIVEAVRDDAPSDAPIEGQSGAGMPKASPSSAGSQDRR